MKKVYISLAIILSILLQPAYAQTAQELYETAKVFMQQNDFANASLVLTKSLQKDPTNIAVAKDLAMSYYYQKSNDKALEVAKTLLDNEKADDQCFHIAGLIYAQLNQNSESEKAYKKGIKKFPDSGPLYNELGEAQIANKNKDAIKTWERGIEMDPSFSKNYYNAARYYYFNNGEKIWSIIYGEIYVNMDPTGANTQEMKQLILETYKKIFIPGDAEFNGKSKNMFVKNYTETMNKQADQATAGINTASLSMIRARFILDWYSKNNKPAFKLFIYQQQLLREGLFEAYNQWLFTAAENESAYNNWVKTNSEENKKFIAYQKSRIFKIPLGQYYK
jgi:tetratricopeptide (TPR) repeat protein